MYPSERQIARWADDHGATDVAVVRGFAATYGRLPFDADELTRRAPSPLGPEAYPPFGTWTANDATPQPTAPITDASGVADFVGGWLAAHPLAVATALGLGYLALTGGGRHRLGL